MKNQALIKITLRYLPTLPKNAIFQNPPTPPDWRANCHCTNMDGSLLFPSSSEIQGVLVPFKSGQGVPGDIVLSHQFQTVAIVLWLLIGARKYLCLSAQSQWSVAHSPFMSFINTAMFAWAVRWRVTRGEKFRSQ